MQERRKGGNKWRRNVWSAVSFDSNMAATGNPKRKKEIAQHIVAIYHLLHYYFVDQRHVF